jgi:hypothetical protein
MNPLFWGCKVNACYSKLYLAWLQVELPQADSHGCYSSSPTPQAVTFRIIVIWPYPCNLPTMQLDNHHTKLSGHDCKHKGLLWMLGPLNL